MKKIIILTTCFFYTFMAISQVVVITCNTPGEDCFNVNPNTPIAYGVAIDNFIVSGNPWNFNRVNWKAEPSNQIANNAATTGTATIFTTQWQNNDNTINNLSATTRRITASVTMSRTASNGEIETKTVDGIRNPRVKYIGSITQMTVTGTGLNTTVTHASTVNVPCSISTLTLSVPTPTTDSQTGVVYSWFLPSGWSGSSSTSTMSAQTGIAGQITVEARRGDGTFIQTFFIFITRPTVDVPSIVTVDGSSVSKAICSGQSKTFTGANLVNITNRFWTTSGGIYINGPTSAPNVMIGGTSQGALTLTVTNACQISQSKTVTIYAGTPTIETATVNGDPQSVPNYIYNPALLNIWTDESGVTDSWAIINGTGSLYFNGQYSVSAYAYPFIRVQATFSNQCGTGGSTIFYLHDISGGYYRMASPNPADNSVSAEVLVMNALKKVTLVSDSRSGIVRTFNPSNATNANTHRNNNTFSFDVAQLPRGKYYLNFTFEGNKTFSEQIVLR